MIGGAAMWRRTQSWRPHPRGIVATFVAVVMIIGVSAPAPASARDSGLWSDARCPSFYELFSSGAETGVTVCRGMFADNNFFVQNVGTTVWLVSDGTPRLQWIPTSRSQSIESKILQEASPAPDYSVWFAPGDRFLFTRGYLESSWNPQVAETLAIYGLDVGVDQVTASAVEAGVAVTAKQLIKNKNWRPAFTTCLTSLIGFMPDDDPTATDAAAEAYLKGVSTAFSTGACATQLASAKEKAKLTVPLTWAPVAEDLARLQRNTTWVERFVEGAARLLQSVK